MKVKFVSLLILGLCVLSLIVGLVSTREKQEIKQACPVQPQQTFLQGFSASGGDKIALITMEGPISYDGTGNFFKDFSSADGALKALERAIEDKSVKGVIFRINSPGGTVAMSQEIYNTVLKLRKEVPVVVSMADVAASGGYYIASAADRIYANPGTLTGSIGVIMETINAGGLLSDKLGIKSEIIKSGKFKDTGNIYRALSPDERELLYNLINNTYNQFLNAIIKGRVERDDKYKVGKTALTEETLRKYADGRIFTGEQALSYGFVDKLGGLAEAQEGMKQILKRKEIPVVYYNKPAGFEDFFIQMSNKIMPKMNTLEQIIPLSKKYPRQPLLIWE